MKKPFYLIALFSAFCFIIGLEIAQGQSRGHSNFTNDGETDQNAGKKMEKTFTNSLGMTFIYIQPGSFMMGSPEDEPGREKNEIQHQVTLTKGFYMQTTEVTQAQFIQIMGINPSYFEHCGDDCPVDNVSWLDAKNFIRKLNQIENTNSYRLPTEAEWEYAAQAGSTKAFANGK